MAIISVELGYSWKQIFEPDTEMEPKSSFSVARNVVLFQQALLLLG